MCDFVVVVVVVCFVIFVFFLFFFMVIMVRISLGWFLLLVGACLSMTMLGLSHFLCFSGMVCTRGLRLGG